MVPGSVRRQWVVGSAVIEFAAEGDYRVVARFNPEAVEWQARFDRGERVEPGQFELAEPGEPEFDEWKSPDEAARVADFVERFWADYRQRKPQILADYERRKSAAVPS